MIICALAVCTACSTGGDPTTGGLTVTREDGSIVELESCDRLDAVEVTFTAVVGSEFGDGEVVRAAGTLTTEIGDPPR